MTVTLTTRPTQLVAGQPAHVDFAISGAGNFIKGYVTDAPLGSALKTQLLETGASRLAAFALDAGKAWDISFEMGGVYTLQLEQYSKGASIYGGGYQDAPDGYQVETLVSSSTATLSVGQKVTQEIGFGGDTATLTLFVIGNNVIQTTVPQHGFASPILSDPSTQKAKTAALNTAIVSAVAALAGQTATVLIGDIKASVNDLISNFNSHATNNHSGTLFYHPTPDADNDIGAADLLLPSVSPEGFKNSTRALIKGLGRHMTNDSGAGTGSATYHVSGQSDWLNAMLVSSAGSEALDTFVAYADVWRAYEGHRIDATIHNAADTTNVAAALPPLLNLHRLFLAELAKQSPAAPASVNSGVTALVHSAGFEEQ